MGGEYSINGGDVKYIQSFCCKTWRKEPIWKTGVDGKILEWILGKSGENVWLGSSDSGQGPVAGSCKHDIEHSGSIKGKEFLDKKDSALWS
jgi:hypothetical protein